MVMRNIALYSIWLVMMTEPGDCDECGAAGVAVGGVQVQSEGEVRYECEEGYVMVGEMIRSCMNNGSWSGSPPLCSKILLSDNSVRQSCVQDSL